MKSLNKIIVKDGMNAKLFEDKGGIRYYEQEIVYGARITVCFDLSLSNDCEKIFFFDDQEWKAFGHNLRTKNIYFNRILDLTVHDGRGKGHHFSLYYKNDIVGEWVEETPKVEESPRVRVVRYFLSPSVKVDVPYIISYQFPNSVFIPNVIVSNYFNVK